MDDSTAMQRALELSAPVLGNTSPNPPVGAVILDGLGQPVGEGATAPAGGPHAEVAALQAAGRYARGGTAVVTLEPCAHTGRTGPCTDALLSAGVRRVVFAVADPDPQAAGGAARLRQAGVEVVSGLLAEQVARGPLEAWLHATRTGRPHVTWKYAASLDGQVAAADGSSRWITSPQARADVHRLRSTVDAVLTGIGTVLIDDPRLTVRGRGLPIREPLRVVLDGAGRTPPDAAVLGRRCLVITGPGGRAPQGVDHAVVSRPGGRLDLREVLALLQGRGVRALLMEAGPTLAGSFVEEGLVDRVIGYLAPALLGSGGWPSLRAPGLLTITDAVRLRLDDAERIGPDLRITARPYDPETELITTVDQEV